MVETLPTIVGYRQIGNQCNSKIDPQEYANIWNKAGYDEGIELQMNSIKKSKLISKLLGQSNNPNFQRGGGGGGLSNFS